MSEVLIWIDFCWKLYLSWRQRRVCLQTQAVPQELSNVIDLVTFERSRAYALDKLRFSVAIDVFSIVLHSVLQFSGLHLLWNWTEDFLLVKGIGGNDPLSCALFVFVVTTLNQIISIPFEIYFHFVLEEKHGFNRQTLWFYVKEQVKTYVLSVVSAALLTYGVVSIITDGGEYFYIYLWMFLGVYTILTVYSYPAIYLPLFDSFTALPSSEEFMVPVQTLLRRVNFPLSRLRVVEASRRSLHSNAFTAGLCQTSMIVLYDTILADEGEVGRGCDKDEVLAVLGHELGHWKFSHIGKILTTQLVILLVVLATFAPHLKEMKMLLNASRLPLPRLYTSVVNGLTFAAFGRSWMSRRLEYEADEFAASLGLASYLRRSLVKISKDNLQFPVEDWLYAHHYFSHPPLLKRLEALRRHE